MTNTGVNMLNKLLTEARKRLATPDRSTIRRAAERYLNSLHYTLYADWDISKSERKSEAAEWLTTQVMHVLEEMGNDD